MAPIEIVDSSLLVHVEGMDRVWALKSQLTIPLVHVRAATVDPVIADSRKGWRLPGVNIRGVIVAGTFHHDGDRVFWDVHDGAKAVVIELADETYQRLVIEVDDPQATAEQITKAIAPA